MLCPFLFFVSMVSVGEFWEPHFMIDKFEFPFQNSGTPVRD